MYIHTLILKYPLSHLHTGKVAAGQNVEHRVTLLDFKAAGKGGLKSMSFDEQVFCFARMQGSFEQLFFRRNISTAVK